MQFVVFERNYECLFNPNCTRKIIWLLVNAKIQVFSFNFLHSISTFCTQFQLSACNFNFLQCLRLIDMLSANQHGESFACILFGSKVHCVRNIAYTCSVLYTTPRNLCDFFSNCDEIPCRLCKPSIIADSLGIISYSYLIEGLIFSLLIMKFTHRALYITEIHQNCLKPFQRINKRYRRCCEFFCYF